jgi:hypothetical protein
MLRLAARHLHTVAALRNLSGSESGQGDIERRKGQVARPSLLSFHSDGHSDLPVRKLPQRVSLIHLPVRAIRIHTKAPAMPSSQPSAAEIAKCCVAGADFRPRDCNQLRWRSHCIQSCQSPPAIKSVAGPIPFIVQPRVITQNVPAVTEMASRTKSVGLIPA